MKLTSGVPSAFYFFCRQWLAVGLGPLSGAHGHGTAGLADVPGGVMVVSNHQSFLDPLLLGIAADAQLAFLARNTLFNVWGLGAFLRSVGVHPIARGRTDASAVKTVMRLLRGGSNLLMFPEGTRTHDGEVGAFKPGAAALAIRCRVPVMPACVSGAYDAWPRDRALPRRRRVKVRFGSLMDTTGGDPGEVTQELRRQIVAMQSDLR
jgi:1-acyl-sn-glycerol-3-phosphate acyltransferase